MKLIGILLLLNSIALTTWWVTAHGTNTKSIISLCLIAVFAGLVLILQDRITELSINGVGSLKAAVQQAEIDADSIASLKARVESQSATVDLVASEASKARTLSEDVADKNIRAEKKLDVLDKAITRANSTLTELESTTEFTVTVVAAQNDDRHAFDKLKAWSEDQSNPFREEAAAAWVTILDNHNSPISRTGFTMPWADGFDPSKLSIHDLAQEYQNVPSHLKFAMIEYIWRRNDFQNIERLDFLMSVIENDDSLNAVEFAARFFKEGTKQNIKPLATEYLSKWWKEHRNEFKENS